MSQNPHMSAKPIEPARPAANYLAATPSIAALLCLLLVLSVSSPAQASSPRQSLDSIKETVRAFVLSDLEEFGSDTEIVIGRLDSRLRLHACPSPLHAFSTPGQARGRHMTVGVRCEGDRPWTLYVPVRIQSYMEVLSLANPVARGQTLKESDLRPIRRDIAALPHGYYTDPAAVVGMELRRPLRVGEILTPNNVAAASMITRGQEVTLFAESGGISIIARGEALQDGAEGDRIQVRNLSSQRIVEGHVIDGERVRIPL